MLLPTPIPSLKGGEKEKEFLEHFVLQKLHNTFLRPFPLGKGRGNRFLRG
jgi:hypothetical protein